jgi:hypothetical protein
MIVDETKDDVALHIAIEAAAPYKNVCVYKQPKLMIVKV